jgi:two-component system KDP operon response regulator KdpE
VSGSGRILVVDDEPNILNTLAPLLRSHGYDVSTAANGRSAMEAVAAAPPDLMILDLGLPDMDGVDVCAGVRARTALPILVLSARGREADKVRALDAGADDYVTKPFGADELLARVRAALRRADAAVAPAAQMVRGGLVIDRERFRVECEGQEIRLTPKEFELLSLLAAHAGRVMTHRALLTAIWGRNAVGQPEHLRVLVGTLRKKIEPDPSSPKYILTEPWVGYRFADV